jgi:elongation factor 2
VVRYKSVEQILKIMRNIDQIRNIGIIAHVDHGKTTLTDSLLAAAGIISEKLAGEILALDYLNVEQQRGITVKAANISLYYEFEGKPYVINLIDTPGHVDFSGKVSRSLRVLDGAIVVVDAVEGVMTQTETVLRQALEERVRPLLFINKIDRLIKELRMTPKEIQDRFVQIIKDINNLIDTYGEPGFKEKWRLDPVKGQIAFGSAKDRIGLTIPYSQRKGIKISDLISAYEKGREVVEDLQKKIPLHEVLLEMVIKHVPNPREAQAYRIPKIWRGPLDSEIAKAMISADPDGPTVYLINDMRHDPHAGLVATGRVLSGWLEEGKELYLVNAKTVQRVLQTSLYMGPFREPADKIYAGNIAAVLGLDRARSGETAVDPSLKEMMVPFEKISYISEPVVTIAVEPRTPSELTKMVDALKKLIIEDPNLVLKINEETGEYLLSGMGQVHLEVALTLLKENFGVEVKTSSPLIIYRETIRGSSPVLEGKSPNKHNRLYISVEPLNEETIRLIATGEVSEDQDPRERAKILRDKAGWDYDEARRIWAIDENINVFVDRTSGIQYLREVRDTIIQGFRLAMREGPLAMEPVRGVKVILHDAVIHEDPAHRGPAQLYPATRNPIYAGMLMSKPTLLEPIQKVDIKIPIDYMGEVTAILTRKRGRILEVHELYGNWIRIISEIPIAESMDLAQQLRGATSGRALWGTEFSRWMPVPENMLPELIAAIRTRKGLKPEPPKPDDFLGP